MGTDYARVIEAVERLAPPALQAQWDCSGLQVAAPEREVRKMAVCLDAVPELVEKALDEGCDFILSHHPLALKAELPRHMNAYRRVLQLLLAADVPLYAAHTSLDVNMAGPAGFLGRALGLRDCEILDPEPSPGFAASYGYGEVGELGEPVALASFCGQVMELLHVEMVSLCGLKKKDLIRRVAYCGGSGSSLAARARELGADIFITGDVKYHSALETEICMLDVGHYSMEAEMMRRMAQDLSAELKDTDIVFQSSPNPFQYIYQI